MFVITRSPSQPFRTYESVVTDALNKHQMYDVTNGTYRPIIQSFKPLLLRQDYVYYVTRIIMATGMPGPNIQIWQDSTGKWYHASDAIISSENNQPGPAKIFDVKRRD